MHQDPMCDRTILPCTLFLMLIVYEQKRGKGTQANRDSISLDPKHIENLKNIFHQGKILDVSFRGD